MTMGTLRDQVVYPDGHDDIRAKGSRTMTWSRFSTPSSSSTSWGGGGVGGGTLSVTGRTFYHEERSREWEGHTPSITGHNLSCWTSGQVLCPLTWTARPTRVPGTVASFSRPSHTDPPCRSSTNACCSLTGKGAGGRKCWTQLHDNNGEAASEGPAGQHAAHAGATEAALLCPGGGLRSSALPGQRSSLQCL